MKKIARTKLALRREALLHLSETNLRQVAGGIETVPAMNCVSTKVAQVPAAATVTTGC